MRQKKLSTSDEIIAAPDTNPKPRLTTPDPDIETLEITSLAEIKYVLGITKYSGTYPKFDLDGKNFDAPPANDLDMAEATSNPPPISNQPEDPSLQTLPEIIHLDNLRPDDCISITTGQGLTHDFRVLEVSNAEVIVAWLSTIGNNIHKFPLYNYFILREPIRRNECLHLEKLGKRKKGKGRIMKTGKIVHIKIEQGEEIFPFQDDLDHFKRSQGKIIWKKFSNKFKKFWRKILRPFHFRSNKKNTSL